MYMIHFFETSVIAAKTDFYELEYLITCLFIYSSNPYLFIYSLPQFLNKKYYIIRECILHISVFPSWIQINYVYNYSSLYYQSNNTLPFIRINKFIDACSTIVLTSNKSFSFVQHWYNLVICNLIPLSVHCYPLSFQIIYNQLFQAWPHAIIAIFHFHHFILLPNRNKMFK